MEIGELFNEAEFRRELAELLAEREMSQSKLSKETGIPQPAISSIIRGQQRPYLDQIVAIAKVLNISIDQMVGIDHGSTTLTSTQSTARDDESFSTTDDERLLLRVFRASGRKFDEFISLIFRGIASRDFPAYASLVHMGVFPPRNSEGHSDDGNSIEEDILLEKALKSLYEKMKKSEKVKTD